MPSPTLIVGVGGAGKDILLRVQENLIGTYGQVPREVKMRWVDALNAAMLQGQPGINLLVSLNDNAYQYAQQVQNGGHPCVSQWFDANSFVNDPNGPVLLTFANGSSAFRQLGRFAFFKDINKLPNNAMLSALHADITSIGQIAQGRPLSAFVVCSLAGGTGAGMFADMAHLIRIWAKTAGMTALIHGCFVLPRAFTGTQAGHPMYARAIHARSFAAMREINRFGTSFEYAEGLPMDYACGGNDPILNARVDKTLYSRVYYFDGERPINSLLHVPLQNGVAPTIAEFIGMMVDDAAVQLVNQHDANIPAYRRALGLQDKTIVGSFGTYSFVLPVDILIEDWCRTLAVEVLNILLQPIGTDNQTNHTLPGLRVDMAGGVRGQNGWDRAEGFWQGLGGLSKVLGNSGRNWKKGGVAQAQEAVELSAKGLDILLQELQPPLSIGVAMGDQRSTVDELLERCFSPERTSVAVGLFRSHNPKAMVFSSSSGNYKIERDQPTVGANRVHSDCEKESRSHLLKLEEVLQIWANTHVNGFRLALEQELDSILNGTASDTPNNAVANRSGKLGHARAFLQALASDLDGAVAARELNPQTPPGARRLHRSPYSQHSASETTAYSDMAKDHAKQQDYFVIRQQMIELDRWDLAARMQQQASQAMHDLVAPLEKRLGEWEKSLATSDQGLYAGIRREEERIQTDRNGARPLDSVVKIINDPAYEATQYQFYRTQNNALVAETEALCDLRWQVERRQVVDPISRQPREETSIGLKLRQQRGGDGNPDVWDELITIQAASPEQAPAPASVQEDGNKAKFLSRCRQFFLPARQYESICRYLISQYQQNVGALAAMVVGQNAPLLQRNTPNYAAFEYLVYHQDPNLSALAQFVQNLKTQIAALMNVTLVAAPGDVPSLDRFRFTFISRAECIDSEQVAEYQQAMQQYLGLRGPDRKLHHVFPAETNAVDYEMALQRLLPYRVVSQLEDKSQFNLAVDCWLYGEGEDKARLINEYTFHNSQNVAQTVWRLTVPPEQDVEGEQSSLQGRTEQESFDAILSGHVIGEEPHPHTALDTENLLGSRPEAQQALGGTNLPPDPLADDLFAEVPETRADGATSVQDRSQSQTDILDTRSGVLGIDPFARESVMHYFLTKPGDTARNDLLSAFEVFCLGRKVEWTQRGNGLPQQAVDVQNQHEIPFGRLQPLLQKYQLEDCLQRLENGSLGVSSQVFLPLMQKWPWSKGKQPSSKHLLIARADKIAEQHRRLQGEAARPGIQPNQVEHYRVMSAHLRIEVRRIREEILK